MKINIYGIRGFPDVQGGVEKHCEELYPRLASKDVKFSVFRRKSYLTKNSMKKYAYIGFNDGWTIRNKYLETPIHSLLSAFKTIKDKPNIVHIHNIAASYTLPLLKLFGLKTVVTYHSANYEHAKWNWFAKLIIRTCEKIVFLFADKVIFVSDYQMKKSGIMNTKAAYIPNGVSDFSKLKPSISLNKFGLKKDSFILTVGRIAPEKRFSDLIEAFSRVRTDMKLVIAGGYDNNSDYFKELSMLKDELGERLVFTGYLPSNDLKLLYENAFCFVLPSENEGMPLVLLEAMSFGLCPLVSNIGPNLAVMEDLGFSFKVRNVNDLKIKLEYLIANPIIVNKKGKSARQIIIRKYNWELAAKQTLSLYNEVLKHGYQKTKFFESPKTGKTEFCRSTKHEFGEITGGDF
jgi:glycosyltransferase involved in cell wall biosynthesis